jgi:hypothetical protein
MLKREQLELLLKINGVSPSSPDEEIRSVLLSASFNDNDIETAIMVLRENTVSNTSRIDGLHKVFRTTQTLKPNEIFSLLGIDIGVENLPETKKQNSDKTAWIQNLLIAFIATIIAFGGVFAAMYTYKVGVFHPTAVTTD